jgi:hypothetical protein
MCISRLEGARAIGMYTGRDAEEPAGIPVVSVVG